MTDAQRDVANASSAASTTLERELAAEQAHVDLVYERLAEATRSAQSVARAGLSLYQSDRGSYVREEDGTGLYERDVFAFQAARRLGASQARVLRYADTGDVSGDKVSVVGYLAAAVF